MFRLVLAVLLTILVVAFAMSNTHPVVLSLVVGPPVKVRLIFLVMSTFLAGMLFSGFTAMVLRLRVRQQAKVAPAPLQQELHSPSEGDLVKN